MNDSQILHDLANQLADADVSDRDEIADVVDDVIEKLRGERPGRPCRRPPGTPESLSCSPTSTDAACDSTWPPSSGPRTTAHAFEGTLD